MDCEVAIEWATDGCLDERGETLRAYEGLARVDGWEGVIRVGQARRRKAVVGGEATGGVGIVFSRITKLRMMSGIVDVAVEGVDMFSYIARAAVVGALEPEPCFLL